MFEQYSQNSLNILSDPEYLKAFDTVLNSVSSTDSIFYQKNTKDFYITINPRDLDLLKVNAKISSNIILPYEISVVNRTFMQTKIYRLVSRKLPKTITWNTNAQFPLTVNIDQTESFLLYITIDTLDDIDQLIDNDLAFVMYSDNTTLSEIDFAIRVPDIRGISVFRDMSNYFEAKDWQEKNITNLDEIIQLGVGINNVAKAARLIKKSIFDMTETDENNFNDLLSHVQDAQYLDKDKLKYTDSYGNKHQIIEPEFLSALINLQNNTSLKSKIRFNIQRISYLNGITKHVQNVDYQEAKKILENYKNTVHIYTGDDITEQRKFLDILFFQIRIPQFGSSQSILDMQIILLNINSFTKTIINETDQKKYIGNHMRAQAINNITPIIDNVNISYDISSQVKENTYTLTKLYPTFYFNEPDSTIRYGYKIVHSQHTVLFPDILDTTDFSITYIHHRPVEITNNNYIYYDFKDTFISKMLTYDQTSYFDGTINPQRPISLLKTDYTIHLYKIDESNNFSYDNTQQIIQKIANLYISDEIKESFIITNFSIINNGQGDILLSDTNKKTDIVNIHQIEIFNDGNTYLNLTEAKHYLPTKYPQQHQWNHVFPSLFTETDSIINNTDFYKSIIKKIDIVQSGTLTPGETGRIFIIIRLNTNLLDFYISQFITIPYAIKLKFNENLYYFLTQSTKNTISKMYHQKKPQAQDNLSYISQQWPFRYEIDKEKTLKETTLYREWFSRYTPIDGDKTVYENNFIRTLDRLSQNETEPILHDPIVKNQALGFLAYPIVIPMPENEKNIATVDDLLFKLHATHTKKIDQKIHFLYFNELFIDLLNVYKNSKKIGFNYIPLENKTFYVINQYNSWENQLANKEYEPINFEQFSNITTKVNFMFNETFKNFFEYEIPRLITIPQNQISDVDQFLSEQGISGTKINLKEKQTINEVLQFEDKFLYKIDLGEIVGNKPGIMTIHSEYLNRVKIKQQDNLEIKLHSIGPDTPDTYQIKIINPTTEYAQLIIQYFHSDFTFAFQQTKVERNIIENIGNILIEPDYINLKYLPIDENYSVVVTITNPNPFPIDITIIPLSFESIPVINIMSFPDNEYLNTLYNSQYVARKPYTLLPKESVKLPIKIIPRRIGVNFHTLYLKIGNTVRPIDIEFISFVNNKPYFVLDEESRNIDFGDVPIGKIETKSIIVKNIGDIMGKINSVYMFGNDSQHFKIFDPTTGEISERLSFNRVVHPKKSLYIPVRFYAQSYGLNTSYAYIETNEPVVDQWQIFEDSTQVFRNAPKYLSTLLRAQVVLEDDPVDLDGYIFLGYVHPTKSKYRNYELTLNNKSSNKIIKIVKISNYMKNYIKIKYSPEPFDKKTNIYITLNPRAFSENIYVDQLFIQYIVMDKTTRKKIIVLKKTLINWQVTTQQYYEFDINASQFIFVSKPFIKTMKTLHVTNLSNVDATMQMSILNDFNGLYSIVPYIANNPVIIPEGVRYTFRILFGGDQQFYGTYNTAINILFTMNENNITKTIALNGIIGDQNFIKAFKRKAFVLQ